MRATLPEHCDHTGSPCAQAKAGISELTTASGIWVWGGRYFDSTTSFLPLLDRDAPVPPSSRVFQRKGLDRPRSIYEYTKYTYTNSEVTTLFSTSQAAKHIGVSKNTLLRWLDEGLTGDVERDWRGWRIWQQEDIERIKAFREAYHSRPIRRARRGPALRVDRAKAIAASMARFGRGYTHRPEESR